MEQYILSNRIPFATFSKEQLASLPFPGSGESGWFNSIVLENYLSTISTIPFALKIVALNSLLKMLQFKKTIPAQE